MNWLKIPPTPLWKGGFGGSVSVAVFFVFHISSSKFVVELSVQDHFDQLLLSWLIILILFKGHWDQFLILVTVQLSVLLSLFPD
jgi:hypothetical protein